MSLTFYNFKFINDNDQIIYIFFGIRHACLMQRSIHIQLYIAVCNSDANSFAFSNPMINVRNVHDLEIFVFLCDGKRVLCMRLCPFLSNSSLNAYANKIFYLRELRALCSTYAFSIYSAIKKKLFLANDLNFFL